MTTVSIILVYYNTPDEIITCLKSIPEAVKKNSYEILIYNNNSPAPLPKISNKKIKVINSKTNWGYSKGINNAVKKAKGTFLVILNPDTILHRGAIDHLVEEIRDSARIGAVGPQMRNADGDILPTVSGFPKLPGALFAFSIIDKIFPHNRYSKDYWMRGQSFSKKLKPEVIGGACFIIRSELFKKIGCMDERFFMYFEEADLCKRINNAGFEVVYSPRSKITHFVGGSKADNEWIEKTYEESRFRFFKKYHGLLAALLAEAFIRMNKTNNLLLLLILGISSFTNFYNINSLMLFIGDQGRDYLAAYDLMVGRSFLLLGIPSSVSWLHQGPLSIYIIAAALFAGNLNPVAPAYVFAGLGVLATFFGYLIGKKLFNTSIGLLAALFFACSPIVVINSRMPYHTSSIPLFSNVFFLLLIFTLKGNRRSFIFCMFFLGILLQLELSNFVLIPVVIFLFVIRKARIGARYILLGVAAFLAGIFPFILHDITHNFTQTGGLVIWSLHRFTSFFGISATGNITTSHLPEAIGRIYQQISGIIFPESVAIFLTIIIVAVLGIASDLKNRQNRFSYLVIGSWLLIPLAGFLIHTAPGVAYFPLIFTPLLLLVTSGIYGFFKGRKRVGIAIIIMVSLLNVFFLVSKEYYLTTKAGVHPLPPSGYVYGTSLSLQNELVNAIVVDSNNKKLTVEGGGFLKKLTTGIDNYQYLLISRNKWATTENVPKYFVFENPREIPSSHKIVFSLQGLYVTKK